MFLRDPMAFLSAFPAILVAVTVHEFAHGKMAAILGDPTPQMNGRLTLNPLRHLDPIGTLMLVFVGFGWAKPVPVNAMYFADRRKGMVYTALAGPVMNLGMAYFAMLFLELLRPGGAFGLFFTYLVWFNVVLAVFNLIPIPPLDGSQVLFNLLPPRLAYKMAPLRQYGQFLLIGLLILGILGRIIRPLILFVIGIIGFLVGLIL